MATWPTITDRNVQYPARVKLNPVSGTTDTYDSELIPGTISAAGTDVNKALFDLIKGYVDTADGEVTSALTATINAAMTPPGIVLPYAGTVAPTHYLLCRGQAVSRTTYATLFSVIGTTYGSGDGSTTFNLPDMQSRAPYGLPSTPTSVHPTLGAKGGEESHTLLSTEMPAHTHFLASNTTPNSNNPSSSTAVNTYADSTHSDLPYSFRSSAASATIGLSSSTGSGGAHNNMPPYITLNYIICTGV